MRGRLLYLAVEPAFIKQELQKLFADILLLLTGTLTKTEVFYYATCIHLVFVNIHLFVDGNGRATRLIEKWFLAKKLEGNAWFIESEKIIGTTDQRTIKIYGLVQTITK